MDRGSSERSSRAVTAIDGNRLAGDESGQIGGKMRSKPLDGAFEYRRTPT
jgi:hypothetical protein